ncbi:MAG: PorV/PorQ family protein [candidate division KSB1 bacterium]|nr:PorV/PorQ family protein [candidate division KSB1 bacterium]MDZ7274323.1 PorV/PorQ family protein [candidate division KSB1 bacterium]MDZ7287155.1 PorV/PorQ family protein [candidate division KSB1 bacterium]MDZ7296920.1 PorV/PorQ family protein [candidate division KSB1 bacterium]MDZ7307873.1 PorV/PorQ family protein [candidate division KSB1 bacterium]
MQRISSMLPLALALVALAPPAWPQSKTGTTIGQFLLIEPSARLAGMGNAGVTSADEILSAYYNPAALGHHSGYGAQFTHSAWLADISYNHAAAALQTGELGSLLLTVTALNSGEIAVRTVEQPLGTGEQYTVSNLALGLGFGRQISDRFAVGVQLNYIRETIWHSSLATFALNVGTLYRISESGLRIGASLSNFGLPAKYDGRDLRILYDRDPDRYGDNSSLPAALVTESFSLPVLFRVGLAWPMRVSRHSVLEVAAEAHHPSDNTESMSVGAEWRLFKRVALRGGYQNLFLKDSEVGLTLGAGMHIEVDGYDFRLDYGWTDHGRLETAQRFSVGVTF